MESSGRAVSKTVPGFEFRATFEGDIEGFRPLKVLVATTVYGKFSDMVNLDTDTMGPDDWPDRFYKSRVKTLDLDLLDSLRESKTLCDVTLIVEGVEFPAHKIVLAASSPYFQAMFTSCFKEKDESKQEIHGISSETFRIILNYIYTGKRLDINEHNEHHLETLFEAACFLQLNYLKVVCVKNLQVKMNVENFQQIRELAVKFNCRELFKFATNFIDKYDTIKHFKNNLTVDNFQEIRELAIKFNSSELLNTLDNFINKNFFDIATNSSFLNFTEDKVVAMISSNLPDVNRQLIRDSVDKWVDFESSRNTSLDALRKQIKTCEDECILIVTGNKKQIRITCIDLKRGEEFTLADATNVVSDNELPLDLNKVKVDAIKTVENKLILVSDYIFVHEYSLWPKYNWIRNYKQLIYDRINGTYVIKKTSTEDDLNFQFDLIASIIKNNCISPGIIFHEGKYYTGEQSFETEESIFLSTSPFKSPLKVFDPINKVMKILPDMKRSRKNARLESLGQYLYVIGGVSDDETTLSSVEIYDPEADSWLEAGNLNVPRYDCISVTLNGHLYVIGGFRGSGDSVDVKLKSTYFNPSTKEWKSMSSMKEDSLGMGFGKNESFAMVANNCIWVGKQNDAGEYFITQRFNLESDDWVDVGGPAGLSHWCHPCVVKRQHVMPYNPRNLRKDFFLFDAVI